MRYPIVVESADDFHAYGVVVPDLPGFFSAGDTLEEAFENAKEAIVGWLECEIDEGRPIPPPSSLDEVLKRKEYRGWILGCVEIDASKLTDKTERITICLPSRVLRRLDVCQGSRKLTP